MAGTEDMSRLHTHDREYTCCLENLGTFSLTIVTVELGATEAIQKHYSRHVVAQKPVTQRKLDFEHRR